MRYFINRKYDISPKLLQSQPKRTKSKIKQEKKSDFTDEADNILQNVWNKLDTKAINQNL